MHTRISKKEFGVTITEDTRKSIKRCLQYKNEFEVNRPWQDFCSDECRMQFWAEVRRAATEKIREKKGELNIDRID